MLVVLFIKKKKIWKRSYKNGRGAPWKFWCLCKEVMRPGTKCWIHHPHQTRVSGFENVLEAGPSNASFRPVSFTIIKPILPNSGNQMPWAGAPSTRESRLALRNFGRFDRSWMRYMAEAGEDDTSRRSFFPTWKSTGCQITPSGRTFSQDGKAWFFPSGGCRTWQGIKGNFLFEKERERTAGFNTRQMWQNCWTGLKMPSRTKGSFFRPKSLSLLGAFYGNGPHRYDVRCRRLSPGWWV